MFVKTDDGGKKDVEITAVTKDNYIVPDKEKHLWHVTMEIPTFDPKNGKRISRPKLQKFGAKTFHALRESWDKQGYTITVLHDPTAYLDELKAKGTTVQPRLTQSWQRKSPKKRRRWSSASVPQSKKHLPKSKAQKRNQSNNNFKG